LHDGLARGCGGNVVRVELMGKDLAVRTVRSSQPKALRPNGGTEIRVPSTASGRGSRSQQWVPRLSLERRSDVYSYI
jgi:hypothetical protein